MRHYSDGSQGDVSSVAQGARVPADPSNQGHDGTRKAKLEVNGIAPCIHTT